ncbi:MAG: hypothetical protein JKY70_10955 [Mucilaginibacter sp.]|nr:hypothetical protein [Mucilaginibacter sp.]
MKYAIVAINPLSHSVEIPQDFSFSKEKHLISAINKITAEVDGEKDLIKISVQFTLNLAYKENPEDQNRIFQLNVESEFRVVDLKDYFLEEGEDEELDPDVLQFFMDLAIHHARGVQSVYIKGTPISTFLLPNRKITKEKDKKEDS